MLEYDEFRAMNTTILVAAEGRRQELEPVFSKLRHLVEEHEERFSRFRQTSELTALNHAAGHWFECSAEMYSLLEEAKKAYQATQGLFDPTILNALRFSGYDRSMDEIRKLKSLDFPENPGDEALSPRFDFADLDPEREAIWMPPGMQLDLGGIAKGWIAEQAIQLLSQYTDAGAVSAGGDMVLLGLPNGETSWEVSLEDPQDIDKVLAILHVNPGALATSSTTKRRWLQQDQLRHHIIDPRRGDPSTTPWLCVTVYAEAATCAEAFAKALLIAGPESARELTEKQPDLQFIAIQSDGSIIGNFKTLELSYVADTIR
jgi:thiamine biosynthesis lipoprotein